MPLLTRIATWSLLMCSGPLLAQAPAETWATADPVGTGMILVKFFADDPDSLELIADPFVYGDALEFDGDGVLYSYHALTGLHIIDPVNGSGTLVGTGGIRETHTLQNLSYDPTSGLMLGLATGPGPDFGFSWTVSPRSASGHRAG